MIECFLICLEDVRFVTKNQWLRLLERSFVVSITQLAKERNTPIYNGLNFLMEKELKLVLNVLKL